MNETLSYISVLSRRIRRISGIIVSEPYRRLFLPTSPAFQLGYSPLLAQIVVTRRCNLACGYCNEYDHNSAPTPLETLRERLQRLNDLGVLAVEFTGGEPLLNPDLPQAVAAATALGFPARMLISNALLFTRDRIEEFNDAGLTDLQISVDGVRPNDETIKVLDNLREKLKLVARHGRFVTTLSAVVGPTPPEEVFQVIDYAKKTGFVPRVLVVHDATGQRCANPEYLKTFLEVKRRIGKGFSESHCYREKLIQGQSAPFKCRAGARYLYVDEFGMVHWCSQQRGVFVKPLAEYTPEDLRTQFYTVKTCSDYCTVGCARTASSRDEWRRQ